MNPVNTLVGRRLLTLVLFMLIPALAQASTYYVSIYGSDYNSCDDAQSPYSPKRSVTAGVACLRGSDTLTIGDGIYYENVFNAIPSGWWGAPTIVRAENRNGVILRPTSYYIGFAIDGQSHITIDGIDVDMIHVGDGQPYYVHGGAHHITLQNGTARNGSGTYGSGIEFEGGTSDNQILNMDSYNNGWSPGTCATWCSGSSFFAHGIYLSGDRNIIDGNRFYNNSGFGIHVYNGSGGGVDYNVVRNNEIYGHASRSVIIASGYQNQFYNNTVHDNGMGPFIMGYSQIVTGNRMWGNGYYCMFLFESAHWIENNYCDSNDFASIYNEGTASTIVNNQFGAAGVASAPPSGGSGAGGNTGGNNGGGSGSSSGGDTSSPAQGGSTSGGGTATSGGPLAAPAVLVSQCNYDGTFTLSWESVPGADNYYVRIDYLNDNVWDSPDYYLDGYGGTVITGSVISGQYYGWWVHGGNSSGIGPYTWSTFICE